MSTSARSSSSSLVFTGQSDISAQHAASLEERNPQRVFFWGCSFARDFKLALLPVNLRRLVAFECSFQNAARVDVTGLPPDLDWLDLSACEITQMPALKRSQSDNAHETKQQQQEKQSQKKRASKAKTASCVAVSDDDQDDTTTGTTATNSSLQQPRPVASPSSLVLPPQLRVLDLSRNSLREFPFGNLPASLTTLNVSRNQITGPIDCSRLPAMLEFFSAQVNQIGPAIELGGDGVPAHLRRFDISRNRLKTFPDLSNLPETLERLDVSNNPIADGTVPCVTMLPASLFILDMTRMKMERTPNFAFPGALSLSRLFLGSNKLITTPSFASGSFSNTIEVLVLSDNCLSLPPDFSSMNRSASLLRFIDVSSNRLQGNISDLSQLPQTCMHIDFSNNEELAGDISRFFDRLPASLTFLNLSNCALSTSPSSVSLLRRLPPKLTDLNLSNNEQICGRLELDGANLPPAVERLLLQGCGFDEPQLTINLPLTSAVQRIDLSDNNIGGVDCEIRLGAVTEYLNLSDNKLRGKLTVISGGRDRAPALERLFAARNELAFDFDFAAVSPELRELDLSGNGNITSSCVDLSAYAALENLKKCDLSQNQLRHRGALDMSWLSPAAQRNKSMSNRWLSLNQNALDANSTDGTEMPLSNGLFTLVL